MAKRREAFGEAVFEIAVTDDSKLKSRMQSSERIVKNSTDRMANDFKRVSVAATDVQQPVADAGLVFSGLAVQASLLGGTMGRAAGQVAILGLGMKSLGAAMFGLPGIILGVTAAVGFLASRMITAKAKAQELKEGLDAIRESALTAFEARQKQLRVGASLLAQLAAKGDPVRALGVAGILEERRLEAEQNTLQRERDLLRKDRDTLRAELTETTKLSRRQDIFRELDLGQRQLNFMRDRLRQLTGLRTLNEQQTQDAIAAIRDANRKTELQKEAEQARKIAEARQKAFQQQLERARATPLGKVIGAAFDIIRERREKAAITGILDTIASILPFGIGKDLIAELRQRLGVGLQAVSAGRAGVTGFTPLSAFAQTGAGRPGVAPSASDDALRKQQERDRTIAAKATAAAVESIERKTGRGSR